MPIIKVADIQDPRLDIFRNLPTTRVERKVGRFLAEGMLLVRRLLASGWPVESLLADEQRLEEIGLPIPDETMVYVVPRGTAAKIVGFNFHRGVIACGIRPPRLTVQALDVWKQPQWLVPVCLEIQDPENLGGILRNAAAFGAAAVILGPRCADPLSRRVLRVSMGASLQVPLAYTDNPLEDLAWLAAQFGATVWATVLATDAQPLSMCERDERILLLLGNEAHGVPPPLQEAADRRVTIPMAPAIDSLNVAVASGIFLHYIKFLACQHPRAK
jgi:tRNA G18 (ribose-2'-O)-methylase SpoU